MKARMKLFIVAMLGLFILCPAVSAVSDSNLVAHWKFDEGSGTIAHDSAGSNHGIIHDAKWTTGTIGGALDFDGDMDYVQVPDDDSLTPSDQITICFWVYNRGGQNAGIRKYASCPSEPASPGNSRAYSFAVVESGKVTMWIFSSKDNYSNITGTNTVPFNEWHHVAGTFNNGQAALYIDGQLDSSTMLSVSSIMNDAQPLIIGGFWDYCGTDSFLSNLNGLADDVRIYNRALSAEEIRQIYQAVVSPEIPQTYYVDGVNGNDLNNGLSPETAFATVQKGIDIAKDGNTVLVYPAVYSEAVDFLGKAIMVQGIATPAGIPIIENPGDFAVSFYNGEDPNSILKNFVIRNSFMAIFIAGSSPTIKNLNIVDNKYGIEAYAGSEPDISNCIFWGNNDSDIFGCEARYSCTSEPGQGNIAADPCFVDLNNGDYHLLSERGRYWPRADVWVLDKVTSPCIDGGDPYDDPADEPMPNGGLINMGAYGGTPYSSMSEWELKGDINHDGKVNMIDFSIFAEYWLVSSLRAREIDNQLACSHNLMAIGRAMMFYANDYEDEFPKADRWCDLLLQYKYDHMTKEMFVCPSAEGGPSHYAINPNARGPSDPYMVLLFETTAGWNQFGGPELLAPENHQGRGCNILFVDGHVEFVESERLDELRWK